jgi:hypothetical protein
MELSELSDRLTKEEFHSKKKLIDSKLSAYDHKKTINSRYILDITNCVHLLIDRICKNDYFYYILIDEYGLEKIMPDYEFKKNIKEQRFTFIDE